MSDHDFTVEAEQAYRSALQICPSSPEAVMGYVDFLVARSRRTDALNALESALRYSPGDEQFSQLAAAIRNAGGAK